MKNSSCHHRPIGPYFDSGGGSAGCRNRDRSIDLDHIVGALTAIRAGLDEYGKTPRTEVFTEKVGAGVSLELVKALATFAANSEPAVQIEVESIGGAARSLQEFDSKPSEAGVLTTRIERSRAGP